MYQKVTNVAHNSRNLAHYPLVRSVLGKLPICPLPRAMVGWVFFFFEKYSVLYHSLSRCMVVIKVGKAVLTQEHTTLLLAAHWPQRQGLRL